MEAAIVQLDQKGLVAKGKKIYARLRNELEPRHKGEIVAIEVDSEEYFLGRTVVEATDKARKRYPGKVFFTARVGFPVVYSHRKKGMR